MVVRAHAGSLLFDIKPKHLLAKLGLCVCVLSVWCVQTFRVSQWLFFQWLRWCYLVYFCTLICHINVIRALRKHTHLTCRRNNTYSTTYIDGDVRTTRDTQPSGNGNQSFCLLRMGNSNSSIQCPPPSSVHTVALHIQHTTVPSICHSHIAIHYSYFIDIYNLYGSFRFHLSPLLVVLRQPARVCATEKYLSK